MKLFSRLIVILSAVMLAACSAVDLPVKNTYQLLRYSSKHYSKAGKKVSIVVSEPIAVTSYETEQMLYMKKPYELEAFAHNAWKSPPANMLYPLIMQSLQSSGYFYAVASSPYAEDADYRLDTQLLKLHQNFLSKPSKIELSVKVVLTHINDNRVVASKIITDVVSSPARSPYGGVLAANKATEEMTARMTQFVIYHVSRSRS